VFRLNVAGRLTFSFLSFLKRIMCIFFSLRFFLEKSRSSTGYSPVLIGLERILFLYVGDPSSINEIKMIFP
jgi:hypothetical protein